MFFRFLLISSIDETQHTVYSKLLDLQHHILHLQVIEDDPKYWDCLSSALSLGWLDIVVKLLRLHGSYELDQIGKRETENGLVEAVFVLVSKIPRLRPELQAGRLGECYRNKSDFIKIKQFFETQGFLDFLERGIGFNNNLLHKLQDAIGRGQDPMSILPSPLLEPEIITISDLDASGSPYMYDRFPSNIRTEEQEEKRKQILAAVGGSLDNDAKHNLDHAESLSPRERAAERERMVLDIKVKLQGRVYDSGEK